MTYDFGKACGTCGRNITTKGFLKAVIGSPGTYICLSCLNTHKRTLGLKGDSMFNLTSHQAGKKVDYT